MTSGPCEGLSGAGAGQFFTTTHPAPVTRGTPSGVRDILELYLPRQNALVIGVRLVN